MRLLRALLSKQFLVFLFVGGTCAALNLGTGALVRSITDGPVAYALSVTAGFAVGTIASFFLNRRYTFQVTDQPVRPQAVRFGLIALLSIALAALVAQALLWMLRGISGDALRPARVESLAHVGAIGVITVYNFFAMKLFALKKSPTG